MGEFVTLVLLGGAIVGLIMFGIWRQKHGYARGFKDAMEGRGRSIARTTVIKDTAYIQGYEDGQRRAMAAMFKD